MSNENELADNYEALRTAERDAVMRRRKIVLGEAASNNPVELNLPQVGLALSGGGVRSATFSLGLLRGLAQNRDGTDGEPTRQTLASGSLLGRLDYLSTVSGGGYTGGMFGRLVATYGLQCAQALLARDDSPVLDWLRRNGRYLTPGGSRDIGIAVVTYLRAWVAIHAEFMFACILLGLVVTAPHLWQHSLQILQPQGWERWHTPWWALSLTWWAAFAPGLIAAYWAARDAPDPIDRTLPPGWRDVLFTLVALVGAITLWHLLRIGHLVEPARTSLNWAGALALGLTSLVVGQLGAMIWMAANPGPHGYAVALLRNGATRALRWALLGTLALAGLGALDRLSWWILEEFQSGNLWLWSGVGLGGFFVLVLRALMQPLQQLAARSETHARDWLPKVLGYASYIGMVALVTAWLVLLQWFVFAPETFSALRTVPAWLRAALLGMVWLSWVLLTAGNVQMANTSSLHSFYRARLTRAYLAVGNRQRSMDDAAGRRADVTRVVEGDDTRLSSYRPEFQGGPIHLINTCLNQTRDDKSGLYNADRKGTSITASWRGFEIGPRDFVALKPDHDSGTLARWIAVSGAAASPGAGAYTSRGLALLVYFLGVRLGHWMHSPCERTELRWLSRLAWRAMPKPMMLASEASATFFGVERPWWYLSDGGHFENSGVYALLKREVGFIILCDAGCDERYEFGDLENLVRKARIDFGAEIDFYSQDEAASLFTLCSTELTILSPEDMANNHSCRGVLLARIRYRERPGVKLLDGRNSGTIRPEGTMLVIKPNLHDALDVDLLAYAQKHSSFPHEPTSDQSFDEAQWESYHRLGEDFGRALHGSWLTQLPGWRSPARHGMRVAARLGSAKSEGASATPSPPLWRRNARAAAIGTTLGVGASGTLLLSLWQIQDQVQRNRADEQSEARQLFTEVSKGLQSFNGSCPRTNEYVITQASLLLELRGSPLMRPLERAGLERLAGHIADECVKEPESSTECLNAYQQVQGSLCAMLLKPANENTALNYWHPGTSPQEQARDSRKVLDNLQAGLVRFPVFGTLFSASPQVVASNSTSSTSKGAVSAVPQSQAMVEPTASVNPETSQAAAPISLDPCRRVSGRTTLYIHIYDESSRPPAKALRQALQNAAESMIVVAPVENVARSADLRQQRRPVPWPQPTLILHDPRSKACAKAISGYIQEPWLRSTETDGAWLRDLPASLQARPGVIELWLPPTDQSTSEIDQEEGRQQLALQSTDQNQTSWLRSK